MKYPFTPELLDALPEELAELFRGLELTLLQEICSRLKISENLNEVAVSDIKALRSHGIDLEDIKKAIADTTNTSMDTLNKLFDDVVERNQKYYNEVIDLAKVTKPAKLVNQDDVEAIRQQTEDEFRNITQSMGFLVDSGREMLPPAKVYQWALDSALLQIESGAFSYNQAIQMAVKQLADSGLQVVDYESDHHNRVDVAVRRAVMSGVNSLNQSYREQSMEYLDTDLVEVTAHQGARDIGNTPENHRLWQGFVYRWSAKPKTSKGKYPDFEKVCGFGLGEGIGGWNCRHSFWPFIEGISERTYTNEELANIDPPPFEYEGRTYTAYEATQKQRSIEWSIRKQKRLKTAYESAGLTDKATAANIKLRRLNQKYKEFSKAAGLPEQRDRLKAYTPLNNAPKSDILSSVSGENMPITDEAINRVPKVVPEGWSDDLAGKLQEAHKNLLHYVKEEEIGTEAAATYSMDMKLVSIKMGKSGGNSVSSSPFNGPHLVMHNHPDGRVFSDADIKKFLLNAEIILASAVGHDGSVYIIQKTEKYNPSEFFKAFARLLPKLSLSDTPENYERIMYEFLEGVDMYGVRFISRR